MAGQPPSSSGSNGTKVSQDNPPGERKKAWLTAMLSKLYKLFVRMLQILKGYGRPVSNAGARLPFYKTNEFWGTFGAALALVLSGAAFGMTGHMLAAKLLFCIALPFIALACWCTFCRMSFRKGAALTLVTSVVLIAAVWKSYSVIRNEESHSFHSTQNERSTPNKTAVSHGPKSVLENHLSQGASPSLEKPVVTAKPPARLTKAKHISPRIGRGVDAYKNVSDEQLGKWAMEESDKINEMAEKSIDKSLQGMKNGLGRPLHGPIYFFTNDFRECCAEDVVNLRNEILARLGPSGKNSQEIEAWNIFRSGTNRELPQKYQPSWPDPMLVEHYAPYLRQLGLRLYRQAIPRSPPTPVRVLERAMPPDKKDYKYKTVFAIQLTAAQSAGYVVLQFQGGSTRLEFRLGNGQTVSDYSKIENPDLRRQLSSITPQISTHLQVFQVGRTFSTPTNPIYVIAYGNTRDRVLTATFFDE